MFLAHQDQSSMWGTGIFFSLCPSSSVSHFTFWNQSWQKFIMSGPPHFINFHFIHPFALSDWLKSSQNCNLKVVFLIWPLGHLCFLMEKSLVSVCGKLFTFQLLQILCIHPSHPTYHICSWRGPMFYIGYTKINLT